MNNIRRLPHAQIYISSAWWHQRCHTQNLQLWGWPDTGSPSRLVVDVRQTEGRCELTVLVHNIFHGSRCDSHPVVVRQRVLLNIPGAWVAVDFHTDCGFGTTGVYDIDCGARIMNFVLLAPPCSKPVARLKALPVQRDGYPSPTKCAGKCHIAAAP